MDRTIKSWYIEEFQTDDMGFLIDEEVTFKDFYVALKNHNDVYDVIGVQDSLVRERVFNELSYRKDVDYNTIYDMWLGNI